MGKIIVLRIATIQEDNTLKIYDNKPLGFSDTININFSHTWNSVNSLESVQWDKFALTSNDSARL